MVSKVPQITRELIEYLDHIIPDRVPSLEVSDRELWAHIGKVHLVRHLKSIHEEQNNNILQGE